MVMQWFKGKISRNVFGEASYFMRWRRRSRILQLNLKLMTDIQFGSLSESFPSNGFLPFSTSTNFNVCTKHWLFYSRFLHPSSLLLFSIPNTLLPKNRWSNFVRDSSAHIRRSRFVKGWMERKGERENIYQDSIATSIQIQDYVQHCTAHGGCFQRGKGTMLDGPTIAYLSCLLFFGLELVTFPHLTDLMRTDTLARATIVTIVLLNTSRTQTTALSLLLRLAISIGSRTVAVI